MFGAFVNLLLYSNFWIAACATAMTLQTYFILEGRLVWSPLIGFVFSSTLFLYALHRIVGLVKVQPFTNKGRYQVISKFKSHILVYALLSGCLSAYFFFQLKYQTHLMLLIPGLISLAYVLPIFAKKRRLRDLPFIKIFLVAVVWAWVTVMLPFIEQGAPLQSSLWLMLLERACFIFAITLPFDVRDLEVDKHNNVKTIPSTIGIKKTKAFALALLILSTAFAAVNAYQYFYEIDVFFGIFFSTLITASILNYMDKTQNDYYFTGLVDGTILIQFMLILLVSLL